MNRILHFLLFSVFIPASLWAQNPEKITIVIHGGAGTISKQNMTAAQEEAYAQVLKEALDKGYAVLERGGSSMEAVAQAIMVMEDSPLFNAGKGAVFTHEGTNEMDASVMEGRDRSAGAVAGITTVKNPIRAAIAVMEQSDHVMLAGQGADHFAREKGLEIVDPSYFYTERRFQSLQKALKNQEIELDHNDKDSSLPKVGQNMQHEDLLFVEGKKFGTVGCVALDQFGNLSAGTSTGGMTNKRYGRIGDAPIIGAGTYANNETCAVSATGHGEYFIRSVVGHDIAARMAYKNISLKQAADEVVMQDLVKMGGTGGVIALDAEGNIAMPFNTSGMYRGYKQYKGQATIAIYKDK